jgi:iron-regulated transporter 1
VWSHETVPSPDDDKVGQRLAVALSCAGFWYLATGLSSMWWLQYGLFVLLSLLACMEKLCSIMNLVAVERDWVRWFLDARKDADL